MVVVVQASGGHANPTFCRRPAGGCEPARLVVASREVELGSGRPGRSCRSCPREALLRRPVPSRGHLCPRRRSSLAHRERRRGVDPRRRDGGSADRARRVPRRPHRGSRGGPGPGARHGLRPGRRGMAHRHRPGRRVPDARRPHLATSPAVGRGRHARTMPCSIASPSHAPR